MSLETSSPNFLPDIITTISFLFSCVNRNSCLCVSLFFLSQENATIVLLRTGITVGNNNLLCQLPGEMAVSFYSPPIYASSSDRNTFTCLSGRGQLPRLEAGVPSIKVPNWYITQHVPGCEDSSWMLWRTCNTWKCVSGSTKWGQNLKEMPAPSWIPLVLVCLSE